MSDDRILNGIMIVFIVCVVLILLRAIILDIQREQYLADKHPCERYASSRLINVPAGCYEYFTGGNLSGHDD